MCTLVNVCRIVCVISSFCLFSNPCTYSLKAYCIQHLVEFFYYILPILLLLVIVSLFRTDRAKVMLSLIRTHFQIRYLFPVLYRTLLYIFFPCTYVHFEIMILRHFLHFNVCSILLKRNATYSLILWFYSVFSNKKWSMYLKMFLYVQKSYFFAV